MIRENCYPKKLNKKELQKKCLEITNNWCKLHRDKNIKNVIVEYEDGRIILKQGRDEINNIYHYHMAHTYYDVKKKEMTGHVNYISEDLRDYLRREGIKIYTDKPFESIKPEWL